MPATKQPAPKRKRESTRPKQRTMKFLLTLTPAEMEEWRQKSEELGLTVSEFVRRCVARRNMPRQVPLVNKLTYTELGDINTKLTQLVRDVNSAIKAGQPIPSMELEILEQLSKQVKQVQKQTLGIGTGEVGSQNSEFSERSDNDR